MFPSGSGVRMGVESVHRPGTFEVHQSPVAFLNSGREMNRRELEVSQTFPEFPHGF